MRLRFVVPTLVVVLVGLVTFAAGQERRPEGRGPGGPPGGFGGMMFGGGGGGGMSRLFLLRVPEIQKELELVDEQMAAIQKVQEELGRGGPGGGGPPGGGPDGQKGRGRGRPEGKSGNEASSRPVPASWYFVQAQNPPGQQPEGRRGFGGGGQPPSEEDRARFEQMRLDRARQEKAKLSEILLPHQMKRLTEIYIQQAGAGALDDEDVAKELNITADQKAAMGKVRDENRRASMEQFQQGGGGGGDPDAIRAKAAEMRKAGEEKIFALLTSEQRTKFDELKGKPFDLPENAIRNIFAGRGGPGGRGPGGPPGENRGKRPESN